MLRKEENSVQGLVSIVMPAYNVGDYIDESIRSVQAQTYTNWELLIVDDCSTDDTVDKIKTFMGDTRIKFLQNERNSGAAISRNYALREANGKWVAFLDADDVWLPEKIEQQLTFMIQNGYKFCYTDYRIRLNGEWKPYINTGPKIVTKRKLYNYCYFSTITVMYDREYIGLVQIADLKKNNDYAMWFQIIEKAPCYRLPLCLSYYYKHDHSVSSGSKWKLIKYHYIMYRKALEKGKCVSALLTVNNLFWGVLKKITYRKKVENEYENIV